MIFKICRRGVLRVPIAIGT